MINDEQLLSDAIHFHGHLGPYLVLGLRAGLHANQILGRNPMTTTALIAAHTAPPQSCFADGVQLTTGCTFGKNNISMVETEGLAVTFRQESKQLILHLRKEIIHEINSLPPQEEAWESYARSLYASDIHHLFDGVALPQLGTV
jgi:formylmethanofuran dehydrogenase subunit E